MGFTNFKIEGRGLGSAIVLEFLLYYMTKPEYQLQVREAIYLDSMLDFILNKQKVSTEHIQSGKILDIRMFIILFQQDLEQISLNVPLEIWMDLWSIWIILW